MFSDPANHSRPRRLVVSNKSHPYIVGVFLMMVVYGLYLGRDFLTATSSRRRHRVARGTITGRRNCEGRMRDRLPRPYFRPHEATQ